MSTRRRCGGTNLSRVLYLRKVPAAQNFPLAEPARSEESSNPVAMDLCNRCGLAQLAYDDAVIAELRRIGPASPAAEGTAW
jgi:hypothetical protein